MTDASDAPRQTTEAAVSSPTRSRLIVLAIFAAVVVVDAVTKVWVVSGLADANIVIAGDWLTLVLVRNSGAAFSQFQGLGPVLGVVAIIAAGWIFYYAGRVERIWQLVGLGLIAGGAIGNVIDRAAREPAGFFTGHVVDFVSVSRWPVFNVADACVVVGVGIVIFASSRAARDEDGSSDADADDEEITASS